jgi:hypothetical protein
MFLKISLTLTMLAKEGFERVVFEEKTKGKFQIV